MTKLIVTAATLLALSGSLLSCSKSGEEAVKDAENQVFAVHDEVMPKIDDLMKLRKRLRQRITALDSLKSSGSAAATLRTDEDKEEARRLVQDLTVADSLMMGWMSHYNGDTLAKLPPDDALRYLSEQKDQITDVKSKITTSLEKTRQFLGKQ